MPKHKVSVCIPVFNCERYIREAIRSVLMQSFTDFELLILDNASTDGTEKIIHEFNDARIRVVRNLENIGFTRNWNLALSESHGEYIKILPADDYIEKNCLYEQVAILDQNSNVSIVGCARRIIDKNSKIIFTRKSRSGLLKGADLVVRTIRSGTNIIGEPGSVLFRRGVVDGGEQFAGDLLYVIDLDFWIKALKYGNSYIIEDKLSAFRVSDSSESVALIHKQAQEFCHFIDKLIADDHFKITGYDARIGKMKAYLNCWMRWIFYKLYL